MSRDNIFQHRWYNNIYILNIQRISSGRSINSAWIYNTSKAEEGIREVLKSARYDHIETISDFDGLHNLLEGNNQDICIFNTHGEVFPLPRNGNHHHFLVRLREKIYNNGWILINLTGVPFSYYWNDNDTNLTLTGANLADGLNEILEQSPTRVSNILPTVNILTGQGSITLRSVSIRVPSLISISRCISFSNALPNVVFYGISTTYGSAVLPIGAGYLIFNGMWSLDLGSSPNYHTDKFLGRMRALFLYFVHRTSEPPNTIWELEDLLSTIDRKLGFMLRNNHGELNGRQGEKLIQDRIEDILKIRDLDYTKETQIPYATINRYLDFSLDDFGAALEVKLCNSKEDRIKIQEEINADITVYRTQYNYLLFVVYDLNGFIADKEGFIRGLTEANPNTWVIVPIH